MYPPKWIDESEAYNIMRITLRSIAETCEENGVYIAVEPHGRTPEIEAHEAHSRAGRFAVDQMPTLIAATNLAGSDPYEMLEAVIDRWCMCTPRTSQSSRPSRAGKVTGTAVGWRAVTGVLIGGSSLGG